MCRLSILVPHSFRDNCWMWHDTLALQDGIAGNATGTAGELRGVVSRRIVSISSYLILHG